MSAGTGGERSAEPGAPGWALSAQGLRWPAEWEPHAATWLTWPHNAETWPGRLPAVERAFVAMAQALAPGELVAINLPDAATRERVAGLLAAAGIAAQRLRLHVIPSDDAWVRDHGPLFLCDPRSGEVVLADFDFDAWGGKYPPWERDAAIPARMAEVLGRRRLRPGFVLEGGAVDGDGDGTLLTTEECLLNPNRGPLPSGPRDRAGVEAALGAALGAERVVWLGRGIAGDDTDGHVDDLARFVAPGRVVVSVPSGPGDADAPALRDARARLAKARDARGRALEVVELPAPQPVVVDGARCPASYVNFYLADAGALVPVCDGPDDEAALAVLRDCLDRPVIPIPARDLVVGLGGVHCLTQQEPVGRAAPARD